MFYDQQEFDIRFEWGERGVQALAPISQVLIVVDVLSFSTSVDIAVNRGAIVFPYQGKGESAGEYASSLSALLAHPARSREKYSLSPESLLKIQPGTRIVLPSLNGSRLALQAKPARVLAGCLRNAQAVANAASQLGSKIAVIPAGERWKEDLSLRPSFEDLIGAGAIISYLRGSFSPEAASAAAAFQETRSKLGEHLERCSSGKELIEMGYAEDVRLASQVNVSDSAPVLVDAAFLRSDSLDQHF